MPRADDTCVNCGTDYHEVLRYRRVHRLRLPCSGVQGVRPSTVPVASARPDGIRFDDRHRWSNDTDEHGCHPEWICNRCGRVVREVTTTIPAPMGGGLAATRFEHVKPGQCAGQVATVKWYLPGRKAHL